MLGSGADLDAIASGAGLAMGVVEAVADLVTGRRVDIGVIDLFHIREGVLVERWALLDDLGALKRPSVTAV